LISKINKDFNLSDSQLAITLGATFALSSFERAQLTGGLGDNTFTVSGWTHDATLDGGGGGEDLLVSIADANFVLTDLLMTQSTGGKFRLANIDMANLTGGVSDNDIDAHTYSSQA